VKPSLIPVETPIAGGWHDRVRLALARCTFLPASAHQRFSRHIGAMALAAITEAQWAHVMRLAWRYRRQMPSSLVPPHGLVKALPEWTPRPPKELDADKRHVGKRPRRVARAIRADRRQLDLETYAYQRDWPDDGAPSSIER
jgi:hypothetical protein